MAKKKKERINYIDIEKVIRGHKHKILSNLPQFVVNYLKKVIRQDEMNDIVEASQPETGVAFWKKNLEVMNIKVEAENFDLVPKEGKFIFVSNHVLGAIDGIALIAKISEKFVDIRTITNEILSNFKNVESQLIPVDVFGKNSVETIKKLEEVYESNDVQIVAFPSGEVARKYKGIMDDGKWHRSFIRNAVQSKRDIVPVYIDAQNSKKFYRIANLRRFFGIKMNIELFLLPQELIKQKNKTVKLIFGKPISHTTFDESKSHLQWASEVKNIVYSLYQPQKK